MHEGCRLEGNLGIFFQCDGARKSPFLEPPHPHCPLLTADVCACLWLAPRGPGACVIVDVCMPAPQPACVCVFAVEGKRGGGRAKGSWGNSAAQGLVSMHKGANVVRVRALKRWRITGEKKGERAKVER